MLLDISTRLFFSEKRVKVEHSAWENTTAVAWEFLLKHPYHMKQYKMWVEYVEDQKAKWRVRKYHLVFYTLIEHIFENSDAKRGLECRTGRKQNLEF